MKLDAIIEDMQGCIFSLQQRVEELKTMDDKSAETILMTRQEAADLIGKSLRQLDRDCRRYGIRKVHANGGIRIPKIDLLVHMGWSHDRQNRVKASCNGYWADSDDDELPYGDKTLQ